MPPTPGNICTYTSVQQKEDAFHCIPFLVFTPLQRLTNHYYKQMHTIRIGTSDGPGVRGSSCHIGTCHGQDDCKCSSTLLGQTC